MTDEPANKMWGRRFKMSPAELMVRRNAPIGIDKALARGVKESIASLKS